MAVFFFISEKLLQIGYTLWSLLMMRGHSYPQHSLEEVRLIFNTIFFLCYFLEIKYVDISKFKFVITEPFHYKIIGRNFW